MKKRKFKEEKGAITLFVLISILFFVIVLVGLYINSSNKIQKQQAEIDKIQKTYETQNIDDVYNKVYKSFKNNENEE